MCGGQKWCAFHDFSSHTDLIECAPVSTSRTIFRKKIEQTVATMHSRFCTICSLFGTGVFTKGKLGQPTIRRALKSQLGEMAKLINIAPTTDNFSIVSHCFQFLQFYGKIHFLSTVSQCEFHRVHICGHFLPLLAVLGYIGFALVT